MRVIMKVQHLLSIFLSLFKEDMNVLTPLENIHQSKNARNQKVSAKHFASRQKNLYCIYICIIHNSAYCSQIVCVQCMSHSKILHLVHYRLGKIFS